jgi:hypothetical protein
LVQGYAKRLKRALGDHGWMFLRAGRPVVVDNGMLSRHTANAVLKQAGIKLKF